MIVLAVLGMVLAVAAMAVAVSVRAAAAVASTDRLEELVEDGVAGSAHGLLTVREQDRTAALAQVVVPAGSVMVGWLTVVVVRSVAGRDAGSVLTILSGAVVALVVAFLCESVPRAAAVAAPERVLAALAVPHQVLLVVLGPVVTVSGWLAGAALLPVGMWLDGGRGRAHTAGELAEMISALGGEGGGDVGGRGLFAGALDFLDVQVADVMARRDQIVTVPRTSTVTEAERLVHRSGHSRVLVVGAGGEVTGFLHAKDLIALPADQRGGLLPAGLVRVALRVGPEDRVDEVLPRMRRARRHVAVVEQRGDVLGLVTLEDVLEAIVGDIRDESDQDHGPADPRGDEGEHP